MFDVWSEPRTTSKIARIVERFKLVRVDSASIRADVVREKAEREQAETEKRQTETSLPNPNRRHPKKAMRIAYWTNWRKSRQTGERAEPENPTAARTEVSPERTGGVPSGAKSEAEPSAPSHRESGEPNSARP